MKRTICTLYLATLLFLSGIASAQVATTQPFNSFGGGPFDTVNLGNLNVHFAVPVVHKAGRGMPFAYDLTYDSSVWTPVGTSGHQTWVPSSTWGWTNNALGNSSPYISYSQATGSTTSCGYMGQGSFYVITYGNFVYHDQFGVKHPFSIGGAYIVILTGASGCPTGGPQPSTPSSGPATDGSGYILNLGVPTQSGISTSAAYRNGQSITGSGQGSNYSATDANGNTISFDPNTGKYTDTLGQNVVTVAGANPVSLTYTPPSGTAVHYSVNYGTYNIKTNFGCSGVAEYTGNNVSLVSSIGLPDGTSYSFSYEPTQSYSGYYTGRLKSVTLPTGGTITYTYPLSSDGTKNEINCADGSAPVPVGTSPSMTKALSSPGGQWKYARTQVSGNHWQTTVTSPTGDNTVLDFQEDNTTGNGATYSFYETNRQTNQLINGVQTLLLTTVTCWNGNTSNCMTTAVSSPITSKSVTLEYPSSGLQSKVATYYNSYGLVTEVDQSAYGSAPGSTIRSTYISYASLGNNIYDHPASVSITDGGQSGHVLSKTTYTYDEYTTYPLQQTTNTPQHGSISGSRGNATTIASTVIGTTTLTRHFAYYDTGNVYKSYDVNGAITTYNYDTTAWETNTTKSCGNSFATGLTLPISGLSTNAYTTWNCIGGVVIGSTDLNNNTTTTTYSDADFWRPYSVQDPTGTTTVFTYNPYSTSALANVDSKMLFNNSASVVEQLTTMGTFGQPLYSQQHEAPSGTNSTNYDSTQVLYDSFLRANKSSMPCVSTAITFTDQNQACPSAAVTTSTFDALGRVTQTTDGGNPTPGYVKYTYNQNDVKQDIGPAPPGENDKQKQLEYDALGRLTSVCELTSLTGYAQCGQTNPYNGYMTTYVYGFNGSGYLTATVTQGPSGSQQTRVYTYDLLGRMISEQNPENGTVTYTYDSDSAGTCSGTYNGDLVKLTDAKGNKICYQYDVLHRVTGITYPTGPDSANTPTKTFVYDSATFNSTAMSNPKGRLAEAYTGASGSKITDEFFSYSVRGELTDTWECTPHSGSNGCASVSNYYHVTAGFWANGALNTLSSNISGVPTQTYGVDAMGRTSAVSAASGQNPVTSASYDLANFKTTVTYGSSDSDVVNLDPNTGRMTKYTFNVGSNSDVGQTTWNANGSLATLQVTDTIPSTADTQTCNFTHDDLSRISSVNCLNGATNKWNQTFTYDAFGNITKNTSGPGISFLPTYDTSKNWITALPGITTTTDNNGQMTYDGVHNYTWDAAGKMHSVDTTTLTHDALGRMVEKAVGSAYTQTVYSPLGKKFALMNGQTLQKAYVPLPGAQAVYTSTGLTYYRHADHLGSSRLATTPSRTMYSSTAYAPYGEPYSQAGTTDLSFTEQDQDMVSGIHDFLLRKYTPVQGRWLSPDPAGLASVDPSSPQSWNRYAYVLNNPLALVDPLGDCSGEPDDQGVIHCDDPQPGGGQPPPSQPGYPGCVAYGTEGCIPFPCSMPGVSCGGAPGPVTIGGGPATGSSGGSGGGSGSFINTVVNSALKQSKLGACLNKWVGPGTVLTNANLPIVDFRSSSAQLDQMLGAGGNQLQPGTLGTIQTPVPSTGPGTLYIASELWGNLNESMQTFIHETGNLLAIQQFTSTPGDPVGRAFLGARGTAPGPGQVNDPFVNDKDIGEQLQECVFGPPMLNQSITVTATP